MFSNRVYNFLKAFVMVIAPSAAALYLALSPIHNIDHTLTTVAVFLTISAILGTILLISTRSYYESDRPYIGDLHVLIGDDLHQVYRLEVDGPIEQLAEHKCVMFKVIHEES